MTQNTEGERGGGGKLSPSPNPSETVRIWTQEDGEAAGITAEYYTDV